MTYDEMLEVYKQLIMQRDKVGAEIYFILKKAKYFEVVLVDLNDETELELLTSYLEVIEKLFTDENKCVMKLSEADNRNNIIFEYDLEEYPENLNIITNQISESVRMFNFTSDSYNDIFGYLLKIGLENNYITLFRKHYPVSVISKDTTFSLKRIGNESRFIKVTDDILKMTFGIDFFMIGQMLFINNLNVLERFFDFHNVVKNEALRSIDLIENSGLLVETEALKIDINNITFARKLIRMTSKSRVIGKIPNEVIIKFTKENHILSGKFSYNEGGTKLILNTKKSRKLFLKLMDDDILISELTNTYYDSSAKDEIE